MSGGMWDAMRKEGVAGQLVFSLVAQLVGLVAVGVFGGWELAVALFVFSWGIKAEDSAAYKIRRRRERAADFYRRPLL